METNGIRNSPSGLDLDWIGPPVRSSLLRGGKTASRAAETAIVFMVAEMRKGKVSCRTQDSDGPEMQATRYIGNNVRAGRSESFARNVLTQ